MRSTLRPHQTQAIQSLRSSLARGKLRPMLQAPTGFGKTILAAAIVDGALKKGNRVLFTVPAISLIDQTVESFAEEGITEVGVIQADHPMTDARQPIQVASVQTLQKRFIPDADIVVIDEAHRWFDFHAEWFGQAEWERIPFVGLSATPWTKGLGKYYDDLIIAATTQDLINKGYLSKFEVFAPSHPDLTGVKTVAGDYHEGQLSEAMQDGALVADVVETWLKLGQDQPTLCFGVDRAHAKALRAAFERAGVSVEYIDATTKIAEREEIRERFRTGETKIVCNVGVLTTGVDWDVRCLILARPTKSEILFTQIIGRALRTAKGKTIARILDHSDTHLRLGMVTDIHKETLCDGTQKRSTGSRDQDVPLPKECPKCSFLKPPRLAECPHCGFKPEKVSEVETLDGDLVAFGGASNGKKHEPTPEEKQDFYQQLLGYCHQRGHRQGYADHKFKARFGHWPHKKHGLTPIKPRAEVYNWIKHCNIKFAKSKNRNAA